MSQTDVLDLISRNDRAACSALVQLYQRQTEAERQTRESGVQNGIGFDKVDSRLLTSFAEQVIQNRERRAQGDPTVYQTDLSAKQLAILRDRLPKYRRQLVDILAERGYAVETAPEPEPEPEESEPAPVIDDTPIAFARTEATLPTFDQTSRIERAVAELPAYTWTETADPQTWEVTVPSGRRYAVSGTTCTCPDFAQRCEPAGGRCKHVAAFHLATFARHEEERRRMREAASWVTDDLIARVCG